MNIQFEDHPTDPEKVILRKPTMMWEGSLHIVCECDKCKSQPQRTWVGLTEKDICEAAVKSQEGISPRNDTLRFAIAIESKLKEKNT